MCDQIKAVSLDRLVRLHPAGVLPEEARAPITFVLRQLIDL
jgi:hypothetical protein